MQLIKFLTNNHIPYYIYKLKKADCIIMNYNNKNNTIFILSGILFITKIFSNKELIPIAILHRNNIFNTRSDKKTKIYYKVIALETTYILTVNEYVLNNNKKATSVKTNILNAYKNTIKQYEIMNNVINHKNTKNRILQLILTICLQFGKIKNQKICLQFELSNKNIANFIGTSENTVNKLMKKIYKQGIIKEINNRIICINNVLNLK